MTVVQRSLFVLKVSLNINQSTDLVMQTGMNFRSIGTTGSLIAAASPCDMSSITTMAVLSTQSLISLRCSMSVLHWTRGVPAGTA